MNIFPTAKPEATEVIPNQGILSVMEELAQEVLDLGLTLISGFWTKELKAQASWFKEWQTETPLVGQRAQMPALEGASLRKEGTRFQVLAQVQGHTHVYPRLPPAIAEMGSRSPRSRGIGTGSGWRCPSG
jgi:hypothetical protein